MPSSPRAFETSATRKRRRARAFLGWVMWGGIGVALWPLGQKGYGWWSQRQLMANWSQSATPSVAPKKPRSKSQPNGQTPDSASARAVTLPMQKKASVVADWPNTRLRIPEIDVDAIVVQGIDEAALARGPGHYPQSVLPGANGNCVLAAHRNVYGSWFARVDELWAGSKIELETKSQTFEYQVISVQTVSEANGSVLNSDPNGPPQLTLITCTLPHSPNRIIVTAQLAPF